MDCREFRKIVSRDIDGAIDASERERLERHLGLCPQCLRFREAVLAGSSIHRGIAELSPPPTLIPAIMAAVAARREKGWFRGWLRVAVPAAAAAVVVLGIWIGGLLASHVSPRYAYSRTDVLELGYLDEFPPGSVGEILMASSGGGDNER
jgi:anti-sigma factor RsiW